MVDHHVLEDSCPVWWVENWGFRNAEGQDLDLVVRKGAGPCAGSLGILNAGLPMRIGEAVVAQAQGSAETDYPLELHEVWH